MLKAPEKPGWGKKLLELNLHGGVKSWERKGLRQTCPVQLSVAALLSLFHISLCKASCADCCVCSGQQEKVPCSRVPPPSRPAASVLCSCGHPQYLWAVFLEILLNFCSVNWMFHCAFLHVGNSFTISHRGCKIEVWLQGVMHERGWKSMRQFFKSPKTCDGCPPAHKMYSVQELHTLPVFIFLKMALSRVSSDDNSVSLVVKGFFLRWSLKTWKLLADRQQGKRTHPLDSWGILPWVFISA